jgi:hypothetical protein
MFVYFIIILSKHPITVSVETLIYSSLKFCCSLCQYFRGQQIQRYRILLAYCVIMVVLNFTEICKLIETEPMARIYPNVIPYKMRVLHRVRKAMHLLELFSSSGKMKETDLDTSICMFIERTVTFSLNW